MQLKDIEFVLFFFEFYPFLLFFLFLIVGLSLAIKIKIISFSSVWNCRSMNSMANSTPKRTQKHLNYIPWEPSRAAVSRTDQNQETRFVPIPSLTTQLYRYQNSSKSPQTAFIAKETSQPINKTKPTATVEPFQASINADEIFYGVR